MVSINVDTSGLDEMIKRLQKAKGLVSGGLTPTFKKALDEIGEKILDEVRRETPVGDDTRPDFHGSSQFHNDKTHLRDSWRWKLVVKGSVVEGFAHVTTSKFEDLVDLIEAGAPRQKGAGWELVYTKSVDHPGFPPNKFTKRAQDKSDVHIRELVSILSSELNRIILGK
jgi:hypothetical protein